MKQIESLYSALKKNSFDVKIWKQKRIYFNGLEKDLTAFIDFDEAESEDFDDNFSGASLKVFSSAHQHPNWILNRAKQVKHLLMIKLYKSNISALISKNTPCDNWQDVIL